MIELTREELAHCCGAQRWVDGMLEHAPFRDLDALLTRAGDVWWSLDPRDWREAFASHPRIGDRSASGTAATEQRGMATADAAVRAAIDDGNREYEQRFGHIYLVSAAGKSAEELLRILQSRLGNDPATEVRVAAEEQAKITRLRLTQLVANRAPRPSPLTAG